MRLGVAQQAEIWDALARGPVPINLTQGKLLCYDQVLGKGDTLVGYMQQGGKAVGVTPFTIDLNDMVPKAVSGHPSDEQFGLVHGRDVELGDLVWQVRNFVPGTAQDHFKQRAAWAVNGAYRAGLLPAHKLHRLLLAVPPAWLLGFDSAHRNLTSTLRDINPRDISLLLELAQNVVGLAAQPA